MDTTELIKNSLDWADKRLDLKGEKLTEEQRNYITFALRQNLVKNIEVIHCCKSDSEQLSKRPNTSSTLECFTKSEKQQKGNV